MNSIAELHFSLARCAKDAPDPLRCSRLREGRSGFLPDTRLPPASWFPLNIQNLGKCPAFPRRVYIEHPIRKCSSYHYYLSWLSGSSAMVPSRSTKATPTRPYANAPKPALWRFTTSATRSPRRYPARPSKCRMTASAGRTYSKMQTSIFQAVSRKAAVATRMTLPPRRRSTMITARAMDTHRKRK